MPIFDLLLFFVMTTLTLLHNSQNILFSLFLSFFLFEHKLLSLCVQKKLEQ